MSKPLTAEQLSSFVTVLEAHRTTFDYKNQMSIKINEPQLTLLHEGLFLVTKYFIDGKVFEHKEEQECSLTNLNNFLSNDQVMMTEHLILASNLNYVIEFKLKKDTTWSQWSRSDNYPGYVNKDNIGIGSIFYHWKIQHRVKGN